MAHSHLRLIALLLLGLPAIGHTKPEPVELLPGQLVANQIDADDERFMGYSYDIYELSGKGGDQFHVKADSDVDLVLHVKRSKSNWTNKIVFTAGEEGGEPGVEGTLVLPDDGTYYLQVFTWKRGLFGSYKLQVEPVSGFQLDSSSGAAQTASAVAPGASGSDIKASGLPVFPEVPNIPELADIAAARTLYEELTTDDWTAAVSSGGRAAVSDASGNAIDYIKGNGLCESKQGAVEVRYQPVNGAKRQLVVFRGKDASCAGEAIGLTPGFYWFSDGQFVIGNVQMRRGNLRVRATGSAVIWNDGRICSGSIGQDLSFQAQTCWTLSANIVGTALGAPLASPQRVPGRTIYLGLGYIEGHYQQGKFSVPQEASFVAHDGAYRTIGAMTHYEKAPADAVRRTKAPGQLYMHGLTRFETKRPTALGPAGAYLYYGPVEAGALPLDVRPEPGTLAQYAALAANCPMRPKLPVGWLPWAPNCQTSPDRLDAWSVDGRFRLRYTKDSVTVLQEFSAEQPARPLAEWRGSAFTTDRVPAIVGAGELWRANQLVFRGNFVGLAPEGEGDCGVHGSNDLEPCAFAGGERVDAIYLARVEQRKLEAQREAAVRAREQAATEERARVAAARAAAERQAAAQRAAESSGGFQWGKLAALTLGAVAAGAGELDAESQTDLFLGAVQDSAAGNQGMSSLQSAAAGLGASTSSATYAPAISSGTSGGSYPPRPNTLDGQPACSGYSVDNYKEYYAANQTADPQLHSMCAAAYNYYWMYLNAIRQGYSQQDSDRTYAAFQDAAKVALNYYATAR